MKKFGTKTLPAPSVLLDPNFKTGLLAAINIGKTNVVKKDETLSPLIKPKTKVLSEKPAEKQEVLSKKPAEKQEVLSEKPAEKQEVLSEKQDLTLVAVGAGTTVGLCLGSDLGLELLDTDVIDQISNTIQGSFRNPNCIINVDISDTFATRPLALARKELEDTMDLLNAPDSPPQIEARNRLEKALRNPGWAEDPRYLNECWALLKKSELTHEDIRSDIICL